LILKTQKMMSIVELNCVRTQIIRMICNESNEQVLDEVGKVLAGRSFPYKDAPCRYSSEELKQRVCQATDSIRAGQGYTVEEMKSLHPRLV
jgi:hypothetical protein